MDERPAAASSQTGTLDFSIIIPTHNRHSQVVECLDAIACLRYPPSRFEVVLVDDGSRPSVETLVTTRRDPFPVTALAQPPVGPAQARNLGAALARGRFLAFTDDDCTPGPDWLSQLARRLQENPETVVAGQTVNALHGNVFSTASQELIAYFYEYFSRNPDRPWFIASNNLGIEKQAFLSVGGFDASFPTAAAEDRELCDRLRAQGRRMEYAAEAIVYHRHSLTLRTFWRQHFEYGRGAWRYRYVYRRRRGVDIQREPWGFYVGMLAWSLQKGHPRRPCAVTALVLLSQLANAGGFFWQATIARRKPLREFPARPAD